MPSTLPRETQDEIVRLYTREGLTMVQVGQRVHWSPAAVRRVLVENAIPIRRRGGPYNALPVDEFDRVVDMYQRGYSHPEIGRKLGLHPTTVAYRLHRAGVSSRDRHTAHRLERLKRISSDGLSALSENQRRVLLHLEAAAGAVRTNRIAKRLNTDNRSALQVLRQLRGYRLISSRRPRGSNFNEWTRTDLHLRDVAAADMASGDWGSGWLAIGPFREWANRLVDQERRKVMHLAITNGDRESNGSGWMSTIGAVAVQMGIDERRLHAILYEQKNISLEIADRALQNAGTGTRLEDLWPELGREDELDPEFFKKRGYGQAA